MKNKLKQAPTVQPDGKASVTCASHHEAVQTTTEKIPSNIIIHHKSDSAYDRTALKTLAWFINHWPKRRYRALVSYLVKTNQTFEEFNAFALVNERSITFRKTVAEVYNDAFDWDLQCPSYVRIWRSNKLTHYVCAPECSIYGDYDGEMWDNAGKLKQEVIDEAIRQLKVDLLVENETVNL
jgi:hypothetical protein